MAVINGDRLKAGLLHFYCATRWGFDVVATEHSGAAGVAVVRDTRPDLVLISLSLPDMDGVQALQQVQAASPGTRLIGQIDHCNEYLLHRLGAGVCHGLVLDGDENVGSLGEIIERVRQGFKAVSPRIAQCQSNMRSNPDAFPKLLSTREQEVLVCIAHSLTDAEIGGAFGVSASTALSHRKKIMRKLGIHSTPKLIRYCAEKGFNTVPPPNTRTERP